MIIFDRDSESLLVAQHRRLGARGVLESLLSALVWFQIGFVLTSNIGCIRTLCGHHHIPLWVVFLPLWIGHVVAVSFHVLAFNKLRRFLFIPPLAIAHSRNALLLARREKIPFVILWLRFSGQIFITFVCICTTEFLLYIHFHELETKSETLISMSVALAPLSLLAFLNVLHGIICRGSSLRLFASFVGFVQLSLLAARMDHRPFLDMSYWYLVLAPSLILAFTLVAVLIRYLGVFYFQEHSLTQTRTRLIDKNQAMVAWSYFGGMFFFGGFLCLLIEHLENPYVLIGYGATVCLFISQCIILKGIHLAAQRTSLVLEDYLGDEIPLPLYQDPETGEWVVRSELADQDKPCPLFVSIFNCCAHFGTRNQQEEAPVLGPRPPLTTLH